MQANAVRFAAGLVFLAVCAPFRADAQFIYPPVFVVPPPASGSYTTPKPVTKPPPDKPKPADQPAQAKGGHYEGRTWVPD
jgi:hypothetical protein